MNAGAGDGSTIISESEGFVVAGGVRLANQEAPNGFPMTVANWNRCGRHLKAMADPTPWAHDFMWFCLGLIPACALALIAWQPAYAELPTDAQVSWAWVTPSLAMLSAGALFLAVTMYLTHRAVRKHAKRSADQLYEDMADIHPFELA